MLILIKKFILFTIITALIFVFASVSFAVDISAECAVVINAQTKEIIYEKNAFKRHSMASTTKIMTCILALESGLVNNPVTVTKEALAEGTSIGLKTGYILTLKSLIYGMMLESGNDAANACALYLGKSFDGFSSMMNTKCKEIGMRDTNFVTPSGLDDVRHYSTAYDMALLGAYSIGNPSFREICSAKKYKVDFIKPDITLNFFNHNKLLSLCEGVFGIKTGFTKKSGRCLVSACERDGATLVCVTFNAGDDWNDHSQLYDLSFAELNKSTVKLSELTDLKIYGANVECFDAYTDEFVYHYKEEKKLTKNIIIPKIIYAPVENGEIIGKADYYLEDELVYTSYIYSKNDVPMIEETYKKKKSLIDRVKNFFIK